MKGIVLLSGGMDSTLAAKMADRKVDELYTIFFDYGQNTLEREKECFKKVSDWLNVEESKIVKLPQLKSLGKVPLCEEGENIGINDEKQYVPFRNTIFLSLGIAWGEIIDADKIYIGSRGGDAITPDNSQEYINAMNKVIEEGSRSNIQVESPIIGFRKSDIVKKGFDLSVPFEHTWACLNNNWQACGNCDNCYKRFKGFKEAGYEDPIDYKEMPSIGKEGN
ncbi:MAG: 7-cyano-7-deazaguanine synthase [Candidatus Aenigmatarchaeota archaeon]